MEGSGNQVPQANCGGEGGRNGCYFCARIKSLQVGPSQTIETALERVFQFLKIPTSLEHQQQPGSSANNVDGGWSVAMIAASLCEFCATIILDLADLLGKIDQRLSANICLLKILVRAAQIQEELGRGRSGNLQLRVRNWEMRIQGLTALQHFFRGSMVNNVEFQEEGRGVEEVGREGSALVHRERSDGDEQGASPPQGGGGGEEGNVVTGTTEVEGVERGESGSGMGQWFNHFKQVIWRRRWW